MPTYNITAANVSKLQGYIDNAKIAVESRRALWTALPPAKREAWKVSCPDPALNLMWKLYVWLKEFFGE